MEFDYLSEIVKKIKSVKIAVLGDFCLDAYLFIDDSRSEISVETGLPTNPVKSQSFTLGGAGNLANNLISLGVKEVLAFGVVGNDLFGKEMLRVMNEAGIRSDLMLTQNEKWSTHVYCKPYFREEEKNRFDFGNFNLLHKKTADLVIEMLHEIIDETDLVVINQQVKSGIHTDYFRHKLGMLISQKPGKIFISDIRDYNRSYSGTYLKMNDFEAALRCGFKVDQGRSESFNESCKAAEILFQRFNKPVFITCGSKGSVAFDSSGIIKIPGLMYLGRIDPVGAGDSYLAGVAAALAAGYSAGVAAETGSLVAGVTVRKLFQTGTATPVELLAIGKDPDYVYQPELAEDIGQAKFISNTEFEIINEWPENLNIKHIIFDHDGTISTLREGWEMIMAPMMIKAVLGNNYPSDDRELHKKVEESVLEVIDKTTGVQTLVQMVALIDLVREFGFVPEDEILDMHEYKRIYNNELLGLVKSREDKLLQGELSIGDLTIKNAVSLIEILYNSGIKLYLASGTDLEDVKNEARIFGYDRFFEGGIYGAVGDINRESKKMVLEDILAKIGQSPSDQIVTFGDGPVEIRETRKRGGRSVGVASNEVKRFSLNEKKRVRLIKAGADIIIPDFSQINQLIRLLNVK